MSKEQYKPTRDKVGEGMAQESDVESQEGKFYPVEMGREKGGYTSGPILLTSEGEKRIEEGKVYDVLFQGKSVSCVVELSDTGDKGEAEVCLRGHFISLDGSGASFKADKGTMARENVRLTKIRELQQKINKEQGQKDRIEEQITDLTGRKEQTAQRINDLSRQLNVLEAAK